MNRDQLLELLDTYSLPAFQRDNSEGGTVVATVRGARILGLFPRREGTSANALWTSMNIQEILSGSQKDWEGDGEGSVGGDRLWVSPERNYYYRKPAGFEEWFTPLQMDPGHYRQTSGDGTSVAYENTFDLVDQLCHVTHAGVKTSRALKMLANPLASESGGAGYVGVETEECVEVARGDGPRPVLCPWGLTQVPPPFENGPGTVVIPTGRRAAPIGYFGPIGEDRLRVSDDHVVFRVDAKKVCKVGVAAEDLPSSGPARIAYLSPVLAAGPGAPRPKAGEWLLLVRESSDVARSSDDAIDPAKADPDGRRGVIQAYNNGPGASDDYARFGEIEAQYLPVREDTGNVWRSRVTSRLMAYEGDKESILAIASKLLGLPGIDLFA